MCNQTETTTTAQTTTARSVEDMLRDIAFVLRMTNNVKAEMHEERMEREAKRLLARSKRAEATLAVSM
jgi:hypothetical protein